MTLWFDAHLSPQIARWVSETFGFKATPVRDLKLREAEDEQIFFAARKSNVIVITKDSDFVEFIGTPWQPAQNHLAHLWQHFRIGIETISYNRASRSIAASRFRR